MCTDCWQVLLISETHPGSLTFLSFGVPPSVLFLPLPFLKPPPPPSSTLLCPLGPDLLVCMASMAMRMSSPLSRTMLMLH